MNSATRARYRQIASELRAYLRTEDYRTFSPDIAFTHWYSRARFGKLSEGQKVITDGKGDGGIDAIVYEGGRVTVFQTKYEEVPHVSTVPSEELSEFEQRARMFRGRGARDEFEEWLESVRQDIRGHYRKLFEFTQKHGDLVTFVFVTTKHSTLRSESVEIEDIKRVLSLWDLYREGCTPPTDSIELVLDHPFNVESTDGKFTTYVGLADVQDFMRLMHDDSNERLFAQNVRTDRKSRINTEIRQTYEKDPQSFWLGNNGIYIICKSMEGSGKHFRLVYPSIINGSQTLHSIKQSRKQHSCRILVRILVMDVLSNQQLLGEVIRRTNTQNPMKPVNLLAHDPFQRNIARYLDRYQIFYERREGEWKNEKKSVMHGYLTLTIQELAQWLSTQDPAVGMGRARSRTSELFLQESLNVKLFGHFDSAFTNGAYRYLRGIVWAGLLMRELIKDSSPSQRKFIKIPHLLIIKGIVEALKKDKLLESAAFKALEEHRIGKKKIPKKIATFIRRNVISDFRKLQRSHQRKNPSTDYTNFFKTNKLTDDTYRRVFTKAKLSSLSKVLCSSVDQIL